MWGCVAMMEESEQYTVVDAGTGLLSMNANLRLVAHTQKLKRFVAAEKIHFRLNVCLRVSVGYCWWALLCSQPELRQFYFVGSNFVRDVEQFKLKVISRYRQNAK